MKRNKTTKEIEKDERSAYARQQQNEEGREKKKQEKEREKHRQAYEQKKCTHIFAQRCKSAAYIGFSSGKTFQRRKGTRNTKEKGILLRGKG